MIHASLFSGIGGPEVAAAMLGWDNAFHCEINPFGRAVLEYWFPESKSYEDITKTDFTEWRGRIDVLTGGFPCQPFSYAGKRGGREDERYLWPQMLRVIDEVRPTWVVGENVAGITTMVEGGVLAELGCDTALFGEGDGLHRYELRQSFTIERICRDLEGLGYSVQPMLIPAAAVGAPHRRDRIFILAHVAHSEGYGGGRIPGEQGKKNKGSHSELYAESVLDGGLPEGTIADTIGGGHPAQEKGKRTEGSRNEGYVFPKQWGFTAQRADGLPSIQGDAPDSPDLQRNGCFIGHEGKPGGEPVSESGNGRGKDAAAHPHLQRCTEPIVAKESSKKERLAGKEDFDGSDGNLRPEKRWALFPTVSPVHRGNDGIPFPLGDLSIPVTKWRTEALKAYGNAIVPQVMYRIFQAIEQA